jgi:diadenylate cyclase
LPTVQDVAQQIRWQDIVDVLLLTFVLYRLTLWLRGTVALQVLAGMLVLAVAAFAANQVGLLLTAYLLQALGAVATLVVVVVFRNEIRRALRRVNPVRIWRERHGPGGARGPATTAEILAGSAFELARRRLGALFVVREHDPIDEHLTGGVALDALPSVELMEALFHQPSPLHDGAVIVEDGKVTRAGCFLPLSTSLALPETFGTRHRAAAGLTEVCDATVVVVSEERGVVTLFSARQVEPMAHPTELARRLRGADAHPESAGAGRERRRARAFNALALLGIFVLVSAAWYTVVGKPGTFVTHTVSVELRNVPEQLQADRPHPDRVAVHLRVPRTRLDGVSEGDVEAWVDLSGARPGRASHKLQASAPAGVEIGEIVPATVSVAIRPRR